AAAATAPRTSTVAASRSSVLPSFPLRHRPRRRMTPRRTLQGGLSGGKESGMGEEATAGLTVPRLFAATVAACRQKPALRWRTGEGPEDWAEWTWGEYADLVARAAGGFDRLGLKRGDR